MRLLLDTHAFLWFVSGDEQLSKKARAACARQDSELIISAATVWEMAIKASIGRLNVGSSIQDYISEKVSSGFCFLPVEWWQAAAVATLPFHHRDPFDRLLIAQALSENLAIVTADPAFKAYGVKLLW